MEDLIADGNSVVLVDHDIQILKGGLDRGDGSRRRSDGGA